MIATKTRTYSIAAGFYRSEDNSIEVLPLKYLENANTVFNNPQEMTGIDLLDSFKDGTCFFYHLENFDDQKYTKRKILGSEKGFGHLETSGKKTFLRRVVSYEQVTPEETVIDRSVNFLSFPEDTYVIITTYQPSCIIDLSVFSHCAFATTTSFNPQPIPLEENSLLGRTNEDIKSINSDDLSKILGHEHTAQSLLQNTSPLSCPTKRFELTGSNSMFISKGLYLRPRKNRPSDAKKGQIIYNERKNCFEGFDGNEWKSLRWGDQ